MKRASLGVLGLILGGVLAISLTASASAASEVFVVSASMSGDAHYMESEGDGIFSLQVPLNLTGSTGINDAWKYSFGNGLGDFDNDGDLDYIMAIGYMEGNIYIYEKLGPGNDFASPLIAGTWGRSEGPLVEDLSFAKDLAVADFNEDGFADFVLSFDRSGAAKLYLADGDFNFTTRLLPDAAAWDSAGADAADFNNDEHADFVIAPGSYGQFYVSLGDGKGNFTTTAFDSYDNCSVYGVAAADFTGDHIPDIVAACVGKLYVYEGAGDGVTFNYLTHYPLRLNQSAIDNYDFNGDGIQDLVVANYESDYAGVAVLIGAGNGYFTYDDTYLYADKFGLDRWSLTGPPYEEKKNAAPVAVIDPTYLEVTAGEEVVFDGSSSYDEDGNIVSYAWDFGDGNAAAGVNTLLAKNDAARQVDGANPSHIYYDSGSYTVTLAVSDDQGAESLVTAEVVVKAVPVTVKFTPHHLNLKSRDKWISATIQLPPEYDSSQVDRAGIGLAVGKSGLMIAAQPEPQHGFLVNIWRKIQCRMNFVAVKFDRQEVIRAIGSASGNIVLTVDGEVLHSGGWLEFSGSGAIQTFEKSNRWDFFKKSWRKRK